MNSIEINFIIQFDSHNKKKKTRKTTKFADMSSLFMDIVYLCSKTIC